MLPRLIVLFAAIVSPSLFNAGIAHAELISYDFKALQATAKLSGQDGWVRGNGAVHDPVVRFSNIMGQNVVSAAFSDSPGAAAAVRDFGLLGLTDKSILILEFDVSRTTSSDFVIARFGVGIDSVRTPPQFGIANGQWMIIGEGHQGSFYAVDETGNNISVSIGATYRVRSVWDMSNGTATLSIKNLTENDKNFTNLYFNKEQTVSKVPLGITTTPNTWKDAILRVSLAPGSKAEISKMFATTYPSDD